MDYGGSRIHFTTCGAPGNPPLFLLHSFYMSWAIFKPFLPALSARFFLVAPDFPGFGDSQMLKRTNSIRNYARVLEAIRKELGLSKINLFGFSAGGIVALKYAALFNGHVARLCEQGAPYYHKDYDIIMRDRLLLWASVWPLIPNFLKWLAGWHFVWPILRRISRNLDEELKVLENGRLGRDVARINARAAYEWGRDILKIDLRGELEKISCPVLVLAGGVDPYLSIDSVKRMLGYFSCEPVLEVLPEADHELTLKNMDFVTSKIANFCSG